MGTERERLFSKAIDWVLPPSIIAYAVWGLYMSVFHIGAGWIGCHEASPKYAIGHIVFSVVTVSLISVLIIFLWTLPLDHDVPPRIKHTIAQEWFDQYPRECFDKGGALSVCNRGQCGGRIKPPRTHHCSVCQKCRMDWDHHCPWVGSCLTLRQSKAFLTLLIATAFGTYIMAMPIMSPVLDGAHAMYLVSRSHPDCNRLWWNWWGSYVVFGGPGGRWVLGTALGYWVANPQAPVNPQMCRYGLPFMRPTISATLTVTVALCLAGFCLVLASQMVFRLLKGQTTIEALQPSAPRGRGGTSRRFLWLPSSAHRQATDSSHKVAPVGVDAPIDGIRHRTQLSSDPLRVRGSVVSLNPNARIYDLGIWQNAKINWGRPMFPPRSPPQTLREPAKINPDIIARISEAGT